MPLLPDVPVELLEDSPRMQHPLSVFEAYKYPDDPDVVLLCELPSRAHRIPDVLGVGNTSTSLRRSGEGLCLHPMCKPIDAGDPIVLFDVSATHVFATEAERDAKAAELQVYNVVHDAQLLLMSPASERADVQEFVYLLLEVAVRLCASAASELISSVCPS